jgi:hypothetical protein
MAIFKVGDPPGDPEVMLAEMQREEDDVRWIEDNMATLVEEYGIKFVAVRHRKVIGSSHRLTLLLEDLRERDIAPGSASIEVLYRQE